MLYSCLPCVCYYTHCSHGCLITGVWNLSTSTDYICCIVVSRLCMLLHPSLNGCLITGVWNLSTSTDYICCIVVFLVYVITRPIAPHGCLITGVWNLSTSTDYICCIVVSSVITPILLWVFNTGLEPTSTDYICCIVVSLVYVITQTPCN